MRRQATRLNTGEESESLICEDVTLSTLHCAQGVKMGVTMRRPQPRGHRAVPGL
jgi:hypothetical protein